MYNINDLNETQLKIAKDTNGAILVTAGAGSGKTRLLTHRICYLIDEQQVNPSNILAITFTNKATKEMKERIFGMTNNADGLWISTFHSMCIRILRENIYHFDGYNKFFTICDDADRKKLIKNIIKELNIEKEGFAEKISWHISQAKNEGLSVLEYCKLIAYDKDVEVIMKCLQTYDEALKGSNCLDFDDLLFKTLILFEEFPEVLEFYQNKFKYILVDEFQDTNVVQYKLVKHLAQKYGNIFVVGDEDQCIYSWRGANIDNIKNFITEFNAKIYKLEQNYRSTKNIIDKANKLIKNNTSRIDKTLFTDNEEGEIITYSQSNDEIEEAEYIARSIYNLQKNGIELKNIGVLMRISALSRLIEEKLLNYNIPFVVSGIFKFFDRLEIKNMLAYLRIITNNKDNLSLIRIINYPKRSIGQASIDKLSVIAKQSNMSILEVILNYNTFELPSALKSKIMSFSETMRELIALYETETMTNFIKTLIKKCEILEQYNTGSEEDLDRKANIEQFVQSIQSFENSNPESSLIDYLESVTLQNSLDDENDVDDKVNISTIHASKGLEFDYVYIIGSEEGCFPLSRAMDNPDELEEERRLMYVAITRARKKLYITRAKSRFLYGDRSYTTESRFIKEMGLSVTIKNDNYNRNRIENSYSYNNFNTFNNKPISNSSLSNGLNYLDFQSKIKKDNDKFSQFKVGSLVFHPKFGVGKIIELDNIDGNIYASCQFEKIGVKKLALNFAPLKLLK